ncbi:MAG: alpha/beta fold hydrolase [Ketobacteraceae bacterium]|nr:alpha/beta fold hydrolase [Ketobacteraceae bacterium]
MFDAFFFAEDTLFGCYHPPSDGASERLLVICPPLFDEYRRCYRGLADLANACANQGCHVLRFDYQGTGESFGDLGDIDNLRWIENIHQAIEEGLALSGAGQVVLAGVRFGGTLAAYCHHPLVERLILWDPQASGAEFLRLQDQIRRDNEITHRGLARRLNLPTEALDYSQFQLSEGLKNALHSVNLAEAAAKSPYQWDIVTTGTEPPVSPSERIAHVETGVAYDWPIYHKGELVSKPILETLAKRILAA